MSQILITDSIMDIVWKTGDTVNEVLESKYEGILADRRKNNPKLENKSALKIAMIDAGIKPKTTIGEFINQTMTTQQGGEWLFPAYIDTTLREYIEKDDILKYITNSTVSVSQMVVQASYLDMAETENKKNAMKSRVAEGADIPLAIIKTGDVAIQLHKFGRAVQRTYEAMLTTRVDLFTKLLDIIGSDVVNQELNEAVRVGIFGDGNDNASTSLATTANENIITSDELLDALIEYQKTTRLNPTTLVCGDEFYKQIVKFNYVTDVANGVSSRFTIDAPQIKGGNLKIIRADVPQVGNKNVILILDSDKSLSKYTLNGSAIREYNRNIRNQTELGTISEIMGYSKNLPNAVKHITSK